MLFDIVFVISVHSSSVTSQQEAQSDRPDDCCGNFEYLRAVARLRVSRPPRS